VWALQEAAWREALVLALAVVEDDADEAERSAKRILLEAQLQHAVDQTGVQGRSCTAVTDRVLLDAITGATCGSDLVVVGPHSKTMLRPAMRRP
jgi:hypothetical protein